jgi:hypothetical protein
VQGIPCPALTSLDSNATSYLEREGQHSCQDQHGAHHAQPQLAAEWCDVRVPASVGRGARLAHEHTNPIGTERLGVVVRSSDMKGAGAGKEVRPAVKGYRDVSWTATVDCYCYW